MEKIEFEIDTKNEEELKNFIKLLELISDENTTIKFHDGVSPKRIESLAKTSTILKRKRTKLVRHPRK